MTQVAIYTKPIGAATPWKWFGRETFGTDDPGEAEELAYSKFKGQGSDQVVSIVPEPEQAEDLTPQDWPCLAIVGAPGAGKDTFAGYLRRAGYCPYSSSEPIKQVFHNHYAHGTEPGFSQWACYTQEGKAARHPYLRGWFCSQTWTSGDRHLISFVSDGNSGRKSPNQIAQEWPQDVHEAPVTNREVQQKIGDVMLDLHDDVLVAPIKTLYGNYGVPVVDTSTRAKAQADFVRALGGKVVRIRSERAESVGHSHGVETFWQDADADYEVDNNGGLEDLWNEMLSLLDKLQ